MNDLERMLSSLDRRSAREWAEALIQLEQRGEPSVAAASVPHAEPAALRSRLQQHVDGEVSRRRAHLDLVDKAIHAEASHTGPQPPAQVPLRMRIPEGGRSSARFEVDNATGRSVVVAFATSDVYGAVTSSRPRIEFSPPRPRLVSQERVMVQMTLDLDDSPLAAGDDASLDVYVFLGGGIPTYHLCIRLDVVARERPQFRDGNTPHDR